MTVRTLAIVVSYNGIDWMDYCIGSLLSSDRKMDIICIDNNSQDGTAKYIENNFPAVELIKLNENLGFGKANNIGLKKCLDEDYDYAFLLNQDARIEPDTIDKLVSLNIANPIFGVLSPIHRSDTNMSLDESFCSYLRHKNTPNYISDTVLGNQLRDIYETEFVNAALWLISSACLSKIGYFDPVFTHYGEDDDYLDRVKENGFKVGIVPAALGNHARNKIDGQLNVNYGKENKLSTKANRDYVELLLRYKRLNKNRGVKNMLFFLYFLKDTSKSIVKFDYQKTKSSFSNYLKLFGAVSKNEI